MDADHVTRFARVDFRSDESIFGIKDEDRLSHLYIIGKNGTGKSRLLENMALQDLERGHGLALIDPHGDPVARSRDAIASASGASSRAARLAWITSRSHFSAILTTRSSSIFRAVGAKRSLGRETTLRRPKQTRQSNVSPYLLARSIASHSAIRVCLKQTLQVVCKPACPEKD
jgi:hypothetical protein